MDSDEFYNLFFDGKCSEDYRLAFKKIPSNIFLTTDDLELTHMYESIIGAKEPFIELPSLLDLSANALADRFDKKNRSNHDYWPVLKNREIADSFGSFFFFFLLSAYSFHRLTVPNSMLRLFYVMTKMDRNRFYSADKMDAWETYWDVVWTFACNPEIGVNEVARRVGINKSTVSRIRKKKNFELDLLDVGGQVKRHDERRNNLDD